MANILLLGVKVPFTTGGQDVLMASLRRELIARDHTVDTVELPFSVFPKENLLKQMALWRGLDLETFGSHDVDLVISTKFPSYFAKHPKKSLWLVHQHRPIYELYGSRYSDFSDDPRDEVLRQMIVEADRRALGEHVYISGISKNVVERLDRFNAIPAEVLYPPLPLGSKYRCEESQGYVLSVGRLCSIKRVDLMIKAMPTVHEGVVLRIVGSADEPGIMEYFQNEIIKHGLGERIEFLGRVSDDDLLSLYARAMAVYYAPHDEDYGYVTLEAQASGKPVITAHDSGGTLEFIVDEVSGLVVSPTSEAIGKAVNRLYEDQEWARALGAEGQKKIQSLGITEAGWESVIEGLLSPLHDPMRESGRV